MMRGKILLAAALGLGLCVAGAAHGVPPKVGAVTAVCLFPNPNAPPLTVRVQFAPPFSGNAQFVFRNVATGQVQTFNQNVMGGDTAFPLSPGTYALTVKHPLSDPHLVGYDGILVKPFVVETVNGQKICKDPFGATKSGGKSG